MNLQKTPTPIEKLIKHIDDNILLGANWREKYIQFEKDYIELSNLESIQDYLLEHGANDENVNDKIKKLKASR